MEMPFPRPFVVTFHWALDVLGCRSPLATNFVYLAVDMSGLLTCSTGIIIMNLILTNRYESALLWS